MGKPPRPENAYDSDSYEISSDEEPKGVLQTFKKSLKSTFNPTERARIAAEKKEERRGMIEMGMENLVDGYPKSLTEEEWELVERIKRHPEERRRFEPIRRVRNEDGRRRGEHGSGFVRSAEEKEGRQSSGAGPSKDSRAPLASQRVLSSPYSQRIPSRHSQTSTPKSPSSNYPPAPPLHHSQAFTLRITSSQYSPPPPYVPPIQPSNSIPSPKNNPHYFASVQSTNNLPNNPKTNPNHHSVPQPNITIAHPTTPSAAKFHQQTALADLGNMNRTFIEGFDAPPAGSKIPSTSGKATEMKRGLGNMQRTYLQGLLKESGSEDEEKNAKTGKGKRSGALR